MNAGGRPELPRPRRRAGSASASTPPRGRSRPPRARSDTKQNRVRRRRRRRGREHPTVRPIAPLGRSLIPWARCWRPPGPAVRLSLENTPRPRRTTSTPSSASSRRCRGGGRVGMCLDPGHANCTRTRGTTTCGFVTGWGTTCRSSTGTPGGTGATVTATSYHSPPRQPEIINVDPAELYLPPSSGRKVPTPGNSPAKISRYGPIARRDAAAPGRPRSGREVAYQRRGWGTRASRAAAFTRGSRFTPK